MKRRDLLIGATGLPFLRAALARPCVQCETAYDAVIVGSGIAGLSAAVSAREHGAKRVLVLEKSPVIGGHSILSTGYVSAVRRNGHSKAQYDAACKEMMEDFKKIGGGKNNPELSWKLVRESGAAIDWLAKLGLQWEESPVQTLGGLTPRSYISSPVRAGFDYVVTLNKAAHFLQVQVERSARVIDIETTTSRVMEIFVETPTGNKKINSKSVVIATGGYGADLDIRQKFRPDLDDSFTTTADPLRKGTDTATGDGIRLGEKLGATLINMDCIQVIPFWGGRLTDYVGADIYLTPQGERFVNEGANWKIISNAIAKLPGKTCWVITDSQARQGASRSVKLMNGTVKTAGSIVEMAKGMKIPAVTLQATISRYNQFVRKQNDADFGKKRLLQEIIKPPFYYGKEHLYVHFCCGGLKIDSLARVIRSNGQPIPGVYAAGEVTGGVHGEDRVGGCSITDCLVFGREAGKQLSKYIFTI